MDPVSHLMFGGAMAALVPSGRRPRGTTTAFVLGSLVPDADIILARLTDAEEDLDDLLGLRTGKLRMSTLSSAAATIVPLAVLEFRNRLPEVELSIRCQVTVAGSEAWALCVTKMRPADVARLAARGTGTSRFLRTQPISPSTLPLSLPLPGRPNRSANT